MIWEHTKGIFRISLAMFGGMVLGVIYLTLFGNHLSPILAGFIMLSYLYGAYGVPWLLKRLLK